MSDIDDKRIIGGNKMKNHYELPEIIHARITKSQTRTWVPDGEETRKSKSVVVQGQYRLVGEDVCGLAWGDYSVIGDEKSINAISAMIAQAIKEIEGE